ncbi:hypothetical protein MRX96_040230 [Rhipicephalus microplus]
MKGSPINGATAKEPPTNDSTVDMSTACGDAPDGVKEHKHKPSRHSNMLRSFSLQARICRLCGCLFVKDMFAKPPRSPKVVWLTLVHPVRGGVPRLLSCGSRQTWSRATPSSSATSIASSPSHCLSLLHVVVIIKACCNFFTMAIGARKMVEFLQKADAFEKEVGIPSCLCCGQRAFFWTDIGGIVTFTAYFVSYTAALIHQEQKVDQDGHLSTRETADRVLGFFAAFLFFTYDSVNFVALRHSAEVLRRYVLYLKHCIDGFVGCKVVGCEKEAAQKIQACAAAPVHRGRAEERHQLHLAQTELWIAIGYSAFTSYEFLELARVSQALSNAVQYLHSTINPDDMSLNGSDFFKINLALLVSMAGSIITYTVILVQTSPEYETPPPCQLVTMVTTMPPVT